MAQNVSTRNLNIRHDTKQMRRT